MDPPAAGRPPSKKHSELKELSVLVKRAQELERIQCEIRRLEKVKPSEQVIGVPQRRLRCQACHAWKDETNKVMVDGHMVHRCARDKDGRIIDCPAYRSHDLDDCMSQYKHGHPLITLKAKGNRMAAATMKLAEKVEKKRIQEQHRFHNHPSHQQHMYHAFNHHYHHYNPTLDIIIQLR